MPQKITASCQARQNAVSEDVPERLRLEVGSDECQVKVTFCL